MTASATSATTTQAPTGDYAYGGDYQKSVEIATLADLGEFMVRKFPRAGHIKRCRENGFLEWSTDEFVDLVRNLTCGLETLGLMPEDRVAIMSESRPEWLMADLAILRSGAITVPIYPTLAPGQASYILNDAAVRLAFVSDHLQLAKLQEVRHLVPHLGVIVVIQPDASAPTSPAGSVLSFADLVQRGRDLRARDATALERLQLRAAEVRPNDLATIIYTSGTTGEPRGVMLTHHNLISNLRGCHFGLLKTPADTALSFLPLSHAFERTVMYSFLLDGPTVIFAESIDTLGRDFAVARPTIMTAVPRVFEKLHARIMERVANDAPLKRKIFHWAVGVGLRRVAAEQRQGGKPIAGGLQDRLADALVFSKIRERTGGRLRFLVSGSAPLPRHIAEFFAAIGLPIYEGYGLTEAAPVLSVNPKNGLRIGTVGPALRGVELRIASDGEILARGENIMRGYWNKPEATAEVIEDGWLHTGDIGELDRDGYLSITDRKKDLIVTSGGKKIAPQPLEARFKANPLVAEALIIGNGQRFPAVMIAPAFPVLEQRLMALQRPLGSREELVARPDVVALYDEIAQALNRELAQYEQIKRVALLPVEFSIAGGELTPTLKVRRRVIEDRWRKTIEQIYAS
jgi:long-chain acyl-CoA synthetase